MEAFAGQERIDALVTKLGAVGWKERDAVKDALLAEAQQAVASSDLTTVRDHLESAAKGLAKLELRWEIEEVLEALTPPEPEEPAPEEPEPEADAAPGKLRMSDLDMVYDDPRGLQLYKHKKQDRWFAVQADPMSGQPRMFELHPSEVSQLQAQLKGSPYWVLGAGG